MAVQQELPLPAPVSSGIRSINARCVLRAEGEHRVVVVVGLPVHHYSAQDAVAAAYAVVFLVDAGYATQKEVAVAFDCSERTVRRHQERYHEGGMAALATRSGWRAGRRRVPMKRLRVIESLKAQGLSHREVARRLGVTENAIRQEVGPSSERGAQQQTLPFDTTENTADRVSATPTVKPAAASAEPTPPSATSQALPLASGEEQTPRSAIADRTVSAEPEAESVGMSLDRDPANRVWDRWLACCGLLDDAAPVFGNAQAVPGAAVLSALPVLVASGVFRIAHKVYGEIGPAFYGLRTTLLTLLLMALWRIQRPEALKEHDPRTLGRVLGLDRAPEIKTLRRKLTRLASYHKAEQLGAELARLRVAERGQLLGFLYVDGHVRAYHGQRNIPKAHVARLRLSMPATTDYWVNDQAGDPLFVITATANAGLVRMLPEVLEEVRKLVGDRRVTVVFDRGGWSPKLFQKLLARSASPDFSPKKRKATRISSKGFAIGGLRFGKRADCGDRVFTERGRGSA